MNYYNQCRNFFLTILFSLISFSVVAQTNKGVIGSWDLEVEMNGKIFPSWLQVKQSGTKALVGFFVAHNGSARPISEVFFHNGIVDFSIPPQWDGQNDLYFQGILSDGNLKGTILSSEGGSYSFTGTPAPKLIRDNELRWGKIKSLFDGETLNGWHSSDENMINQWIVSDGLLKNPKSGVNLISNNNYEDFKLHVEVRYPKGSNSGIYLRGRYEVQVEDSYGNDPESILFGGVYGFLTPNQMAANPAGQWQVFDITLIGRRVSISANGKPIIIDQIIPGITGGALDSKEALPGPIMLQGDHGKVEFRNIMIQEPK